MTRRRKDKSHLLEFYGIECDHCVDMEPLIEQLKDEMGLTLRRFEVWYNDDNLKLLQRLDKDGSCGGVPFFYNKRTQDWVCGATTYDNFKAWAQGFPSERFLPPPKEEEAEGSVNQIKSFIDRIRKEGMERMQSRMENSSSKSAEKAKAGAFVAPMANGVGRRGHDHAAVSRKPNANVPLKSNGGLATGGALANISGTEIAMLICGMNGM
mmetsp:Transcript_19336/g.33323  ORF Transcript_19336/g.33323 Transcript_19336/m.33323 type:complete len:210 (+) Transcript_19336:65-694(+)